VQTLSGIDLAVVLLVIAAISYGGYRLSGQIQDRNGFFQGGQDLPWWVVAASIIATVVSAVTFVSVPAAVFAPGGNLTYLQVILGLALGKFVVARLLARPFYASTGVSTSYAYIGHRIDRSSGEASMLLGLILNIINASVKLLTASLVLDVASGWGLAYCAAFVVAISLLWGAMAGIKAVIWTDFLLFVIFACGALLLLILMLLNIERPLWDALMTLDARAKLVLFDFSVDPTKKYTLWSGVIGAVALSVAQGSTQGTWQRVRACRSAREAKLAFDVAGMFYVFHLLILAVGVALTAFYLDHPLPAQVLEDLRGAPDRILPYFIVTEVPVGLSGLFVAAIFAAAISTLDSVLAESADLSVNHIYVRLVGGRSEAHYLTASRCMMAFWALLFYGLALFFNRFSGEGLLDLTFKLPNYVYGGIFACIVLARFGIGRFPTILLGFAVASACVALLATYNIAFFYWCPVSGVAMIAVVWALDPKRPDWDGVVKVAHSS
tara:strand:- start:3885 stop:5366 length:1482 start_codon:yes stop_codon:yes gene_type:complete